MVRLLYTREGFPMGLTQEIGAFVTHRSEDPAIRDRKYVGDGVVASWGAVDGSRRPGSSGL